MSADQDSWLYPSRPYKASERRWMGHPRLTSLPRADKNWTNDSRPSLPTFAAMIGLHPAPTRKAHIFRALAARECPRARWTLTSGPDNARMELTQKAPEFDPHPIAPQPVR